MTKNLSDHSFHSKVRPKSAIHDFQNMGENYLKNDLFLPESLNQNLIKKKSSIKSFNFEPIIIDKSMTVQ